MRLGIVADIHGAVKPLRSALGVFRNAGVDQVISLGDAFDLYVDARFGPAIEGSGDGATVASLLQDAGARGVWGNHDVGLSLDVADDGRELCPPAILDFTARLDPQLVIESCRFSHNEPWLDHQTQTPLVLQDGERYLIVIHALLHGWCAIFDTECRELTPVRCT